MKLILALIGFVTVQTIAVETPRFKRPDNSCLMPNGAPGECTSIKNCPPLAVQIKKAATDSASADFLRRSKCGGSTEVCCQREIKNTESKGPQLQIENCGKTNVTQQHKVIADLPVDIRAWPWIAALGYRTPTSQVTQWSCGGSLINKRYVLTAAHCIRTPPYTFLSLVTVRLGEHDLSSTSDGASPVDYGIEKTIVHEDYRSQDNDVALIRLDKDVQFTDKIRPICLPQAANLRTSNFVKEYPFVVGWVRTNPAGPSYNLFQLPVVDNESCKKAYAKHGATITESHICAGEEKGGKDSCRGYSGGPLMLLKAGVSYQIGIISFGYKCEESDYPGVYTRVTSYLDWIRNNIE